MMQVAGLFVYPIKSCRGIALERAEVTPTGFAWDREFMLVDRQGMFITQRKYAQLACIQVEIQADRLVLSAGDGTFTLQPTFDGEKRTVEVWGDRTVAIDQGDAVARWFQDNLQLPADLQVRLVRQSCDRVRLVNPNYQVREGDRVSFADSLPFLLTTTASLADLNRRLAQPIKMDRFRPNIVVETSEPFAEDGWKQLQIGDLLFHAVKACDRCIVTTTDQSSGMRDAAKEPLRTLAQFRQPIPGKGIFFGQNLISHTLGWLQVGESVTITALE
ncbi:MOSC N-terminal beta barrel domain-containing protein [Oscillatoria amoena NRMC-F 0135]|nr:MOSC N-terminal beta barrel domain-containing protein [Desertifilum sp.]MDI9638076.1 MOSC N-terminal beta barrel domain-containing protein [Geitlerinema splendidum]MDL5049864.1 MOSC N-terminal beta barrel domain-containing protein [Oscillatoria amoena NRMC-F 0135]